MGIGYAVALLVTILVLAPALWLIGWAVHGLVTRPAVQPVRLEAAPRTRPARERWPHALDHALPAGRGEVGIFRAADERKVDACVGPDPAGRCPRTQADGTVPCAARLLALPVPIRGAQAWHVPAGYTTCPLAGYGVYQEAAAEAV